MKLCKNFLIKKKKKKVTTSKTNGTVAEMLHTVASQIFFLTKESLESG